MERIVYRKTLDVHKNGIQFTLQGFETADNMSRRIEISLSANGDTIDLPLEQLEAIMYVTTPSATEPSINECTVKDNKIVYDVLPIVEEGITEMQLKLIETRVGGAKGVLATPKFALEVMKSNTDDGSATQTPTFTALEDAIARANGVYESRLVGIELDQDCTFRANYADGTTYESDILKELFYRGDVLLAQSYAKGGTGVRIGEDTDNSMYYSNVSKSASVDANNSVGEAEELLKEVRKHGVYTAFSVDFETGEVKYISPAYDFIVNKENGNLEVDGAVYDADESVKNLVNEWFATINNDVDSLKTTRENYTYPLSILSNIPITTSRIKKAAIYCNYYEVTLSPGETKSYAFGDSSRSIVSVEGVYRYWENDKMCYSPLDSQIRIDTEWKDDEMFDYLNITNTRNGTVNCRIRVWAHDSIMEGV